VTGSDSIMFLWDRPEASRTVKVHQTLDLAGMTASLTLLAAEWPGGMRLQSPWR
jgi:hypothetical protein